MKRFVNELRREQGLSLIELIAALTLFSLVGVLIYTVMMFGLKSYNEVSVENRLRDEGDLLMSAVITKIYTFGPDSVTSSETINPVTKERETSIILSRDNGSGTDKAEISIANRALTIQDNPQTTVTSQLGPESSIELECNITQPCESGLIHVKLQLIPPGKKAGDGLSLESNFGF